MAGTPSRRAFGLLFGFVLLFFLSAYLVGRVGKGGDSSWSAGPSIGVVHLTGEIASSDDFVSSIQSARDDASVKAVIVRVDSPGGQVAPSQEMYQALRELSDLKPTIASLGSVAASGGDYVAAAANTVVANPGSLTGSIGVILSLTNVTGLMEKVGVQSEVITAGRLKDMGSPFRRSTDAEREIFQAMADEIHQQFIDDVKTVRPLTPDQIEIVSTGRIFTGAEAQRVGLVDVLGGYEDAIALAAQESGIEGVPNIVHFREAKGPWWLQAIMEGSSQNALLPKGLLGFLTALDGAPATNTTTLLWRMPILSDGFLSASELER